MAVNAGVVLRRHARPMQFPIPPQEIKENPSRGLKELLMGCFWVSDHAVSVTSRGYYGSVENHFQTGTYAYNIQIVIPESKKQLMTDVIIARDVQYYGYEGAKEVSLADVSKPGEFSSIHIPDERIADLLPYTVIAGGLADSSEPLEPLYVGRHAAELLRNELPIEGMPIRARK